MVVKPKPLCAAEMDLLTPDERARAVEERIVTDIDELPTRVSDPGRGDWESSRQRASNTASRVSGQRRRVRVTEHFYDRLDELPPEARTADGGASAIPPLHRLA